METKGSVSIRPAYKFVSAQDNGFSCRGEMVYSLEQALHFICLVVEIRAHSHRISTFTDVNTQLGESVLEILGPPLLPAYADDMRDPAVLGWHQHASIQSSGFYKICQHFYGPADSF